MTQDNKEKYDPTKRPVGIRIDATINLPFNKAHEIMMILHKHAKGKCTYIISDDLNNFDETKLYP